MPTLKRLSQIISFSQIASSPIEFIKLSILGFARGHPFNSSDFISRIFRQLFPTMVVRTSLYPPIKIEVNPSDLGHLISFEEILLEKCYDLQLVPFFPEIILDCGAHIGLFSLLATRAYPTSKITAFEPNPKNASFIRRQLTLNTTNVSLIEAAVSVQEGESWFQADYSNTGSLQTDALEKTDSYLVKIIEFPQFVNQLKLKSLLLKMDIEGEENRLIPALIPYLPQQSAIFFESHNGEEGWNQLTDSLITAGFQVQQMRCRYPYADGFALRT